MPAARNPRNPYKEVEATHLVSLKESGGDLDADSLVIRHVDTGRVRYYQKAKIAAVNPAFMECMKKWMPYSSLHGDVFVRIKC